MLHYKTTYKEIESGILLYDTADLYNMQGWEKWGNEYSTADDSGNMTIYQDWVFDDGLQEEEIVEPTFLQKLVANNFIVEDQNEGA